MEIGEVEPGKSTWEKIGDGASGVCFTIGAGAFVPAAFGKKRSFSQQNSLPFAPFAVSAPPPTQSPLIVDGGGEPFPGCTEIEERKVRELFKTIAESGYFGLMAAILDLKKLGREIDHLHPFALLLAAPKKHMGAIFKEGMGIKINPFVEGIKSGIQREQMRNGIERWIPSFSHAMGKTAEKVRSLIQQGNYRELAEYLYL